MQKRFGKFLADWRNEKGRRLRKAFPTKKAALAHASKMQRQTAAKKAHGSGPRAMSSKPTRKPSRRSTTAASRRSNSAA